MPSDDSYVLSGREEEDRRLDAESWALMMAHDRLGKILMTASVLVPLFVVWAFGTEIDHWLCAHHVRGTSYMLTFVAPVAICAASVKSIVVEWLLDGSYSRSLADIYGRKRTPMPKAVGRLQGLIYGLSASSIIVPVSLLLAYGREWDAATGEAGLFFAIPAIVAVWLLVKYILLKRLLSPWHRRLVHAAIRGSGRLPPARVVVR